ncbi:MAG: hypothetical protein ABW352_24805 [Polyangiales bacterium]
MHTRNLGRRLHSVFARAQFRRFIADMAFHRLPVRFLEDVEGSSYLILDTKKGSRVIPSFNTMLLDESDLLGVSNVTDGRSSASGVIGDVYHEATHAWLDLRRGLPEVRALREQGIAHYHDAPVVHDEQADSERLFEEAIAEYVGWRISVFWQARSSLLIWRERVKPRGDRSARAEEQLASVLRKLPSDYDRGMALREFGYQPPPWFSSRGGAQDVTTREISTAMRSFADDRLLENRVPHFFIQSRELMTLWSEIADERHHEAAGW